MNRHLFLTVARSVLSVLPMIGILFAGSSAALAQTAAASPPQHIMTIAIAGTASRATTGLTPFSTPSMASGVSEDVSFANALVQIDSTLVRDPDFGKQPVVIINLTFLKAAGVGKSSKTTYTADYRGTKIRPLTETDVIEITFPFSPDTPQGHVETREGRAIFTLTFDPNGVITGASGTIGATPF